MQVFGLPRQVIRAGCAASRIAAKPSSGVAAIRRTTVERWMTLHAHGLTAKQAAAGVGASCSALYRWAKDAEPKSRRWNDDSESVRHPFKRAATRRIWWARYPRPSRERTQWEAAMLMNVTLKNPDLMQQANLVGGSGSRRALPGPSPSRTQRPA